MASIANDPNGHRRILFTDADGRRKTIRLGKIAKKDAESVARHCEALQAAKANGSPVRNETGAWLAGIGDKLRDKLAAVGLIDAPARALLGPFLETYLSERNDVKAGTKLVMDQAARHLRGFLGDTVELPRITAGDADRFKAFLVGRGCARSTIAKWIRYARHFMTVAARRKLIEENPFQHLTGAVVGDPSRRRMIPAEDIRRVMDVAPDPQWKLLIALARFAGLRVPSEALALQWSDVNWEHNRFTVRASKTEHHNDGGIRLVPLFPEVRERLAACFEQAEPGERFVITRYRDPGQNLRTQLNRYIVAAGLHPWPKPWQNMRASCATELADRFPSHVCASWLGHTISIADKFYRQTTETHFAEATKSGAKSGAPMAQNAAQHVPARFGTESQDSPEVVEDRGVMREPATACETMPNGKLGGLGFERREGQATARRVSETSKPSPG